MKLDLPSLFANLKTTTPGGSASWGTALGQGVDHKISFADMETFLPSLLYRQIADLNKVKVPLGKGGHLISYADPGADYGIISAALYENVFVNGKQIIGGRFILLVSKEYAATHKGRFTLKYGTNIEYNGVKVNEDCLNKLPATLGIASDAGWFINDINVINQDELHFTAYVVDPTGPVVYPGQAARKSALKSLLSAAKPVASGGTSTSGSHSIPYQLILFGAPGTGKSHKVEEDYVKGQKCFRITFHPDTDYASFVGCYKPSMVPTNDDPTKEEIAYAFIPQVFLNAYVHAWNNPDTNTFLVIEELNRGNCAQIFGDVFQLLDRRVEGYLGFSKYTINVDTDIANYLKNNIDDTSNYESTLKEIYKLDAFDFSVMALPDNLFILATMNTSDQSLFPIDSAFKRRWEWEYIPVNFVDAAQFELRIDKDHFYNWSQVLQGLNNYIKGEKKSTNKILGNRFVHAGVDNVISAKAFRDKVLFFLFNDVFRDDDEFKKAFFGDNYEDMFFEDLCVANDTELTIRFIENTCKAKNIAKDDSTMPGSDDENSEGIQEDMPELKPEENTEEISEDTPEVKPAEGTEEKPEGTAE